MIANAHSFKFFVLSGFSEFLFPPLQTLHISAILDAEPEMDEHFIVTLFSPTGGARLGTRLETSITIIQNQAPLGLFSIYPVSNRYIVSLSSNILPGDHPELYFVCSFFFLVVVLKAAFGL